MGNYLEKYEELVKELKDLMKFTVLHNDKMIVTSMKDGSLMIWDLKEMKSIGYIKVKNSTEITQLVSSKDSANIVTGTIDGTVRTWSVKDRKLISTFKTGHKGAITALAVSDDGQFIVTGGEDKDIRVWDFYDSKFLFSKSGAHKYGISTIVATGDNRYIISGGKDDGMVRIWILDNVQYYHEFSAHLGAVHKILVLSSFDRFLTSGHDKNVCIWSIFYKQKVGTFYHPNDKFILTMILTPDEKTLITGQSIASPNYNIWDMESKTHKGVFSPERLDKSNQYLIKKWFNGYFLESTSKGQYIVSILRDNTVRVLPITEFIPVDQEPEILQKPIENPIYRRYNSFRIWRVPLHETSLYHAVMCGMNPDLYLGADELEQQELANKLREVVARTIYKNFTRFDKDDFKKTFGNIDAYLNIFEKENFWPGDTELKAIAMQFNIRFWVYNNEDKVPKTIAYHKNDLLRLILVLDTSMGVAHYNVLLANDDDTGKVASQYGLNEFEADNGVLDAMVKQGYRK